MSEVKRFIAGAVCPQCGVADKLRMFERAGDYYRDCVNCGFEEKMAFDERPPPATDRIGSDRDR